MASPPRRPRSAAGRCRCSSRSPLATAGCSTVSSLNSAARNLDTYELNPLPPRPGRAAARGLVFVAEPTAPGAVGSDRIVMKPNALQVTLVGDGRWVEAGAGARPQPDRPLARQHRPLRLGHHRNRRAAARLHGDDRHRRASRRELLPPGGAPARVVVSMTLRWCAMPTGGSSPAGASARTAEARDTDASPSSPPSRPRTAPLLREAVPWATAVMTGSAGA